MDQELKPKRPPISDPELLNVMDELKKRYRCKTDTELVSKALTVLWHLSKLQDEGFLIGGFTEKDATGNFKYRTMTIL